MKIKFRDFNFNTKRQDFSVKKSDSVVVGIERGGLGVLIFSNGI